MAESTIIWRNIGVFCFLIQKTSSLPLGGVSLFGAGIVVITVPRLSSIIKVLGLQRNWAPGEGNKSQPHSFWRGRHCGILTALYWISNSLSSLPDGRSADKSRGTQSRQNLIKGRHFSCWISDGRQWGLNQCLLTGWWIRRSPIRSECARGWWRSLFNIFNSADLQGLQFWCLFFFHVLHFSDYKFEMLSHENKHYG